MTLRSALAPLVLAAAEQANSLRAMALHADDNGALVIEAQAARWQALADAGAEAMKMAEG